MISVSLQFVLGMALALVMYRAIFGRGAVRAVAPYPLRDRHRGGRVLVAVRVVAPERLDPEAARPHGRSARHRFGSYVAIIIAEVWKTTPFMALLLLAGLALVPDELLEAAKVDGATAWQRFWRITLPLMKPAILVALLFRTLDAFRCSTRSSSDPGRAENRVGVDPRLQPAAQPAQPRGRGRRCRC